MKHIIYMGILLISLTSYGQGIQVKLWPEGVPNQKVTHEIERIEDGRVVNVQDPAIEVFLPDTSSNTRLAVVICPGGGYGRLAYEKEGVDVAKFLNEHGIAGIVLKYRLPNSKSLIEPHKTPLMDAQQAMKIVRYYAGEWHIDSHQVGIMGFSAGGHLASTLGTHFSKDTRPDFMILIYPVISMEAGITHAGSRKNLLGENPDNGLVEFYSNETQVKDDTPPTFIVHSADDKAVPAKNSLRFYEALIENDVLTEAHLYPNGGHGYGLAAGKVVLSSWPDRMMDWLETVIKE